MASDTVVNYILKVDANSAKKGLDQTSKEAKGTAESFDRVEQSSKGASTGIQKVGKSSSGAAKQAKNLRRAGRDLDGAFGDLAQGLSVVNPALGGALMTISDGASVVEGLGRSMTLFLNPAFAIAATVAIGAGLALFEYQRETEAAKKKAEELEKTVQDTTKALESQQSAIDSAASGLLSYTRDLQVAKDGLALLTGELSQYQNELNNAERASAEFAKGSKEGIEDQIKSTKESIRLRGEQISALRQQIAVLKEERKISEPDAIRRAAGAKAEFGRETEEETRKRKALKLALEERQILLESADALEASRAAVDNKAKAYEETLKAAAAVREENRKDAEAEKARRKREREEAKQDAEFEKKFKEAEKRAEKKEEERRKKVREARAAADQLQNLALSTETDSREKILKTLDKELKAVSDLAIESGDFATAEVVKANLRKKAAEELNALNEDELEALRKKREEEEKITAEKKRQVSLLEISSALNEVSKMSVSEILESLREQVGKLRERFDIQSAINEAVRKEVDLREVGAAAAQGGQTLATGSIADIATMINPAFGALIGGLAQIGEKTPAERREELALQVEAIKNGIAFLPEIFLQVVPQIALGLLEAFVDGIQLFFRNLRKVFEDFFSFRDRSPEQRQSRREARQKAIADFFDPEKTASFMSGGTFLPKAAGGIRYTGNEQGLAMLHRGEFVVPASGQRNQNADRQLSSMGGGVNLNINAAVVDRNAVDALVREIEIRFNSKFGVSSSNLFGGR